MKKIKILIVEDDPNLGTILSEYLSAKGYETALKTNGEEGLKAFKSSSFDFCILDVMMPIMDGFTLAKKIRLINEDIPILFLTAKSMKEDTLEGFKSGADDYMTKPFSMEELIARIQAILRRTSNTSTKAKDEYKIGDFTFNYLQQKLIKGTEETKLTSKENELLRMLCEKQNQIVDRSEALKEIWEDDSYFNSRSMDVYITKLRKHFKGSNIEIVNVHGKGFRLVVAE